MSTNEIAYPVIGTNDNESGKKDRRARRRAKVTVSVRLRSMNSIENFDEVCKTIDVSHDGLLLTTRSGKHEKGQLIEVAFPYSNEPSAQIHWQPSEVVRVSAQPHGKFDRRPFSRVEAGGWGGEGVGKAGYGDAL